MKTAVLKKYNKKGNELEIIDVLSPKNNDDEILVNVKAAAINPLDNMIIRGEVKSIVPYKTPLRMGNEFAGIVVKVGKNVTRFKEGDKVYGRMPLSKIGAFSEYITIKEDAVALMPDYLTFNQAATIPLAALTALQAFDLMDYNKGDSLFISGGTGSFGSLAIPIAKSLGFKVITSGSLRNKERVIQLGVDEFFDYKTENYEDVLTDVDCVLDTIGEKELEKEFKILKNGGSLVSLKGLPNKDFAQRMGMSFFKKMLFSIAGRKYDKLASKKNQKYNFIFVHEDGLQLEQFNEIFNDKKLDVSIDSVYKLSQIDEALKKVDEGGLKGKVIISFD